MLMYANVWQFMLMYANICCREKDEELSQQARKHEEQKQQSERALEEFKQQVNENSSKMYIDMKQQVCSKSIV